MITGARVSNSAHQQLDSQPRCLVTHQHVKSLTGLIGCYCTVETLFLEHISAQKRYLVTTGNVAPAGVQWFVRQLPTG